MILLFFLLGQTPDAVILNHQISENLNYKIVLEPDSIPSLAERLAKGYSLGEVVKSASSENIQSVPLNEAHSRLAEQLAEVSARVESLRVEVSQKQNELNLQTISDLREEARQVQLNLKKQSVENVNFSIPPATWEDFRKCLAEAETYVFENRGKVGIEGCIHFIPSGFLPANFRLRLQTEPEDLILFFRDLLRTESEDLLWILPAFDSRFVGESLRAAQELWKVVRFFRHKGESLEFALKEIGSDLPSFRTHFDRLPILDRSYVQVDFCVQWKNLFEMEIKKIEGLELCFQK